MNSIITPQKIVPGSVLGINYSGMHDTSIAIVSPEGEPLFAVSLERVSRKKQDGRLPSPLLDGMPWDRISKVAISVSQNYTPPGPDYVSKTHPTSLIKLNNIDRSHGPAFLRAFNDIPCEKIFVPHHLSHAASSFWGAGFSDAICLVYDGGMSNESWFGGVYQASISGGIVPFDQFSALHDANITYLYTAVTAVLGFTPLKHEGKITGLAAYGEPNRECQEIFEQWLKEPEILHGLFRWDAMYNECIVPSLSVNPIYRDVLKSKVAQFSREDMAATVQKMSEQHVLKILENIQQQGISNKNICLSGGLFANVKINQRISRFGFENIFIAPSMTDDGTALGAAWQVVSNFSKFRPRRVKNMYLGPTANQSESINIVEKLGVKHSSSSNYAKDIASKLASGSNVALFAGASEFGPRALGNRSILAPATEININQKLNARLDRTEFMPFAPIIRSEDADEYFSILESEKYACQFMTITVDCTEKARQDCPAVVHVDKTARPQLVTKDTNPLVYQVLGEYKKLTGKMALINTSFNIHEEPIVCSADDAFRGFFESGLDYLYIEDVGVIDLIDNREVQVNYLRSKIKSLGGLLKISQENLIEINQSVASISHQTSKLQTEVAIQRGQTVQHEHELAAAHEQVVALEIRAQNLQSERDATLQREIALSHQVGGLEATLTMQREQTAQREHELAAAHEQVVALEIRAQSLQSERDAAQQREVVLSHQAGGLEATLTMQREQTAQREHELAAAREQVNALETKAQWLQNEWDVAKAKVGELNHHSHYWWTVAEQVSQELKNVYASRSWLITMPLRRASNVAKQVLCLPKTAKMAVKGRIKLLLVHARLFVNRRPRLRSIAVSLIEPFPALKKRLKTAAQPPQSNPTVVIQQVANMPPIEQIHLPATSLEESLLRATSRWQLGRRIDA